MPTGQNQAAYVVLLFALFVLPRALQRFGLPTAVTALGLGALSALGFGLFVNDPAVHLLATFGIVSLFLFAGLDVEVAELRREWRVLGQHLALRLVALGGVAYVAMRALDMRPRPAALVALALLTPSTGFILDSLGSLGLSDRERFWIRSKAIATEFLALAVLFVTLQSNTWLQLGASALALGAMVALLPAVFRFFARVVVPYAPKSEFAFLIMVAVVCAILTHALGVYYLVGAFVVGMAAQRFREHLPSMASEKMLHAVEAFASLFVPFYFFHVGLELSPEDFRTDALLITVAFLAVIPGRILLVWLPRQLMLRESFRNTLRVSLPMLPTLVFTLVIVEILRDRFGAPPAIVGALILYTLVTTVLPPLVLRVPPPEFDTPELLPLDEAPPPPFL
jgi:Kef-type K+ transport system membrane component KefB